MKSVLLVADNDINSLETWAKVLWKAGYEVRNASNPYQAHQLLENTAVDLAVLDLRLIDDEDENDISGLKIAAVKSFRYIPKVILTAFPISYENLRNILGSSVDELPSAVAFVDKTEGPETLLAVIRQTLETWPRLRVSTIKVSDQIRADHAIARRQATLNYWMTSVLSVCGFLVIMACVVLVWFNQIALGAAGLVVSLLLEALGHMFYRQLERSNRRMDMYHQELLQTYWLEYLVAAAAQLPSAEQVRCTEYALYMATNHWLGSGTTSRAVVERSR
jgi:CheY-like chemotaxis protein